jgi:hypothetical protein
MSDQNVPSEPNPPSSVDPFPSATNVNDILNVANLSAFEDPPSATTPLSPLTTQDFLSQLSQNGVFPDDEDNMEAQASHLVQKLLVKFLAAALVSPFEVTQVLLQVQYLPVKKKVTTLFSEEPEDVRD